MSVAPIDVSLVPSLPELPDATRGNERVGGDFSAWLGQQLRATNDGIVAADDAVRGLAVGEPVNLHQVMVQLERSRLQFELVLQVRNKLLDAYQDLMRMQL